MNKQELYDSIDIVFIDNDNDNDNDKFLAQSLLLAQPTYSPTTEVPFTFPTSFPTIIEEDIHNKQNGRTKIIIIIVCSFFGALILMTLLSVLANRIYKKYEKTNEMKEINEIIDDINFPEITDVGEQVILYNENNKK